MKRLILETRLTCPLLAVVEGTQEASKCPVPQPLELKKEYTTTTGQAHAYNNKYYMHTSTLLLNIYQHARLGRYQLACIYPLNFSPIILWLRYGQDRLLV